MNPSSQKSERKVRTVQPYPVPSLRTNPANLNHHLWLNNGTWYVAYTAHTSPVTAERVRRSLKTKDVVVARQKRDQIAIDPAGLGAHHMTLGLQKLLNVKINSVSSFGKSIPERSRPKIQ